MPTKTTTPMTALYARLEDAGFTRPQIKYIKENALPSWWKDQIAENGSGFAQAAMYIARHTGLSVLSLLQPDSRVEFDPCAAPRFKKHVDANSEKMQLTVSVARQAAFLALQAMDIPYVPVPESITVIRRQVIAMFPGPVTLEKLIQWCWKQGIPVIQVSELPPHKPQAMAVRVEGRPVIVLCDKHKWDAWLAFLVAHELTHIAKGHLTEDDFQYDVTKDFTSETGEEKVANEGARLILCGDRRFEYTLDYALPREELIAEVTAEGKKKGIDPQAILLNIHHHQPEYRGLIVNTLKDMDPDADGPAKVRAAMQEHLAWEELPYEHAQFLRKVSGISL